MKQPEAPPQGLSFEEALALPPDAVIVHLKSKKITKKAHLLFNDEISSNPQPFHTDERAAQKSHFGRLAVNGLHTQAVLVSLTVGDLTAETAVANAGYKNVPATAPVFPGDRLGVITTIEDVYPSKSKPDRGIVEFHHFGFKTDGEKVTDVMDFTRTVIMYRKEPGKELSLGPKIFRPRRSILYMPANNWGMIEKASTRGADSICLDLEDGIGPDEDAKKQGREMAVRALTALRSDSVEWLVRINPVDTDHSAPSSAWEEDLRRILPARPDGIIIPKTESGKQVRWVSRIVTQFEMQNDIAPDTIRLLPIIETGEGLKHAGDIAESDRRVDALLFGADDYAGSVGATRTNEGVEILWARSEIIVHASVNGLQAIDMVRFDFSDADGFREEAQFGRQLGYTGKQVIHPGQIPLAHEAFSPTQEEIVHALYVIAAFEEHEKKGKGAFALDGKMIDMPIVTQARNTLALAHQLKKL